MEIKTTKERNIFEIGFEEGYKIAKRLYKPISIKTVTQSDLDAHNHLKKKKSAPVHQ